MLLKPQGQLESNQFCFAQRNEDVRWDQDFLFLFVVLIKGMRKRGELKIFLSNPRGGMILLKFMNLLWLNTGSLGEHLTTQILWATVWLLIIRVSPSHLVGELLLIGLMLSVEQELLWSKVRCEISWHEMVKNWISMGIKRTSFRRNWFVHAGNRELY